MKGIKGWPPLPEKEWERRRKIAAECVTWAEAGRRLGINLSPVLAREHGLMLGAIKSNVLSRHALSMKNASLRGRPCPNGCGYVSHARRCVTRGKCISIHLKRCPGPVVAK